MNTCMRNVTDVEDLNLLFDLRESRSVLTWARLRFKSDASSVELTVALATSDSFEGLSVTFTIQIKPFMITQKLIGLRCLKSLFLVREQFLLHFLVLDAALKFLKELFDLFSCLYNKEL